MRNEPISAAREAFGAQSRADLESPITSPVRKNAVPLAIALLVGAQLLGELSRGALHLPLPGPVIGMLLMAMALAARASRRGQALTDESSLVKTANAFIGNMGLLFVPAGVGVIAQASVLRRAWLPILVGLIISTMLGLIVTALVMNRLSRARSEASR